MGDFDYTCAVSSLPIRGGDDVRYFLLTHGPYSLGRGAGAFQCAMDAEWFPRVFPLRARYDAHGGVEELRGPAQQAAWCRGFELDLVERGWGDNSIHDVPTTRATPLAELLDATHHGRLLVRDGVGRRSAADKVPAWAPTRRRVEKRLRALGYAIQGDAGSGPKGTLLVDRVDGMTVRVRVAGFGRTNEVRTLEKLRGRLADRWAGMVTCGSGAYAHTAELRLGPRPGTTERGHDRAIYRDKSDSRRALPVASAMIREDVWQTVVARPILFDYSESEKVVAWRRHALALWRRSVERLRDVRAREPELARNAPLLRALEWMDHHEEKGPPNPLWDAMRGVPFTVGLGEQWRFMVEAAVDGRLSAEEEAEFVETVGEFLFLRLALMGVRRAWKPACNVGPQHGGFAAHADWLRALAQLAEQHATREHAERVRE